MSIRCSLGFHDRKVKYHNNYSCLADKVCIRCGDVEANLIIHEELTPRTHDDYCTCKKCGEEIDVWTDPSYNSA